MAIGAGLKAAHRALDLALPLLEPGHSLRFAFLPDGQDPDDLLRAEGPDAVRAALQQGAPLSQVLWERALARTTGPRRSGKAAFEADLEARLERIKDATVRRHYLDALPPAVRELWAGGGPWRRPAQPGGGAAPELFNGPAASPGQRPGKCQSRPRRS